MMKDAILTRFIKDASLTHDRDSYFSVADPSPFLPEPLAKVCFNRAIIAGEELFLTMTVENTGKGVMYNTQAILRINNGHLLGDIVFSLGKIGAGESVACTRAIKIPENWPQKSVHISVVFKEAHHHVPFPIETNLFIKK
jgi:hypothetical protein